MRDRVIGQAQFVERNFHDQRSLGLGSLQHDFRV